jgi:hypothetical protein
MNLTGFPDIILRRILKHLDLNGLRNLSETNRQFNWFCKTQKLNSFSKFEQFSDEILSLDMYPEKFLPTVNLENYKVVGSAWKNIIFFLSLDYTLPEHKNLLRNYIPSNIFVSVLGLSDISITMINKSVRMLDCPWMMLSCPNFISHNLEYLNASEQYYIPSHIDFSGKSLKVLYLNMSKLDGLTFNFSSTLKVVSIFGSTGITSLKGFENVEKLNIDYCDEIASVEPLKKVKVLSMRHCSSITDVSPVKECEQLDISYTRIKDVSMLKKLKKVSLNGLDKITVNVLKHDVIYLR